MTDNFYPNYAKCEIDIQTAIPIVDEKYLENKSIYERCKCIDKMKSSLEIYVKTNPEKYNAYLQIYNNKYSQNKCDEVFKNYVSTNLNEIYSSVSEKDKIRIEAQSKKERKERLFIGVAVMVFAIGIIAIYANKGK